jgi:tRNA modification GTPase
VNTADVILAIASPPGRSPRGIIRISGSGSLELWRDLMTLEPRRGVQFTRVTLNRNSIPAVALVFPTPHSYTGEDSIELQLPGNPDLVERVFNSLLADETTLDIRIRRAEPGEFTARAFLNSRLSLTQAEGVAATIAAQSDAELRAAHFLRTGSLGEFANSVADDLANALGLVEAGIDFTDQDDVIAISPSDLLDRLHELHSRIDLQLKRSVGIEQLQAIPWVVLVGEPNAGKSALFNALLGRERAVVSPISGTTRDVLTEPLLIHTHHGLAEVMLVDLAGFDASDDSPINRLMQQTTREAIARAELILRCVPSTEIPPTASASADEILVWTKSDLRSEKLQPIRHHDEFVVSAQSGEGVSQLCHAITQRLGDRALSLGGDAVALRPRHEHSLRSAMTNLVEAIELVSRSRDSGGLMDPELMASSMRAALDDLAALAGDITPDEVLGRVFATFCVGK